MKEKIYYCDNAAAEPVAAETAEFYRAAQTDFYYNQEALHYGSFAVRRKIDEAAEKLCHLLTGGNDFSVVWFNSGTGAINACFQIIGDGKKILTDKLEHPAVTAAVKRGASHIRDLNCDKNGLLIPENLNCDIAAFHQVQSELGVIQDLEQLFAALPSGVTRFVDTIQGAGKIAFPKCGDIFAISGVKFGAPCGSALLISKQWHGYNHFMKAAKELRAKHVFERITPAVILTLVKALEYRLSHGESSREQVQKTQAKLRKTLKDSEVIFSAPENLVSPYITHLQLPGKQGGVIVRALSEHGIYAGSGSACAAESDAPSPALLALGLSKKAAYSGLRFSFGATTAPETARVIAATLKAILEDY